MENSKDRVVQCSGQARVEVCLVEGTGGKEPSLPGRELQTSWTKGRYTKNENRDRSRMRVDRALWGGQRGETHLCLQSDTLTILSNYRLLPT